MASRPEAEQAGILVLGKIGATIAEAITPFLIVRLLGKADVGALSGLLLIYSTTVAILTAGFPPAVLYFHANRDLAARWYVTRKIEGVLMVLAVGATLLLSVLGWWGDAWLEAGGRWFAETFSGGQHAESAESVALSPLRLFAIYPLLDLPARILPNLLISERRPRGAALFAVLKAIGTVLATLVPAALGLGLDGIVVGLIVFAALECTGLLLTLRVIYAGSGKTTERVSALQLLRFALPLGGSNIVNQLNATLDRYLILVFMSATSFAEYRMGAWQIPVVTTAAYSVGTVYLPRFSSMFQAGDGPGVVAIWRESIEKVSLIVVPVCAVFLVASEEFVTLAFTADYVRAAPVFRYYCVFTMMRVAPFGAVLLAAGRTGDVLRAAIFTLLSNLAVSVPLLFWVGFEGPALGTALAFIPMAAYYCFYIARASGVRWSETFPVLRYLLVVAAAAPGALLAFWFKLAVPTHPAVALTVEALAVLLGFAIVGTLTKLISRDDWRFALDWVRLKVLTRKEPAG